jgi:hypothetical protein
MFNTAHAQSPAVEVTSPHLVEELPPAWKLFAPICKEDHSKTESDTFPTDPLSALVKFKATTLAHVSNAASATSAIPAMMVKAARRNNFRSIKF